MRACTAMYRACLTQSGFQRTSTSNACRALSGSFPTTAGITSVSPIVSHATQVRQYSPPIDVGSGGGIMNSIKDKLGLSTPGDQGEMDLSKPFTLDDYATQLSKASKLGSVASMLPESMRGGLTKEAAQRASEVYTLQVKIVGAMTADEKAVPAKISLDAKKRIALKAGTTPQAVTDTLGKYNYMNNAVLKMGALKRQGKELPKTWEDMERTMGGGYRGVVAPGRQAEHISGANVVSEAGAPGKNAPCPCGSRKLFKRCCWDKK